MKKLFPLLMLLNACSYEMVPAFNSLTCEPEVVCTAHAKHKYTICDTSQSCTLRTKYIKVRKKKP